MGLDGGGIGSGYMGVIGVWGQEPIYQCKVLDMRVQGEVIDYL